MQYEFTAELRRLVGFSFLCLTIGFIVDQLIVVLVVGSMLYMGWTLVNIYRLHQWLAQHKKTPVPNSSGIWGDIFYNLSYREKRAQRQQQRFKAVVSRIESTTAALNDGVVLLNNHDCIRWWNQAAEQLLAFKPIDKGNAIFNYIRHPKFARYMSAEPQGLPLDLPSHHHPERQLQYQLTRFGESEGLLTVRDITRIYKLEEMRKDFVANVSHELRTPLTVIRGYLETLTGFNNIDSVGQKAISQMLQQANHMTELIEDLTTLSKLETDNIESTQSPLELESLLIAVIDLAEAFSKGGHLFSLNGAQDIWIIGNEKELHSAFSNLLFNAVSYSPASHFTRSKPITIRVTIDRTNQLSVSFVDNGIGIAPKHLSRLTERFYRVDSSGGSLVKGTGLGLAIVKHVLLRHEATLNIVSKSGKGSAFTCVFPSHRFSTTADPKQAHLLN